MSIHRYAGDSPLEEMAVHHANDRAPVALLTARGNAAPEQLSSLTRAIEAKGWQAIPAYADGKPVLQVSGFKQESELEAVLSLAGLPQDKGAVIPEAGDDSVSSFREKVSRQSLRLTGAFNLAAMPA